jgi:cytochrome c biogenesis protein CcdA
MAALFALGVMSIGWMVLIAAFIATEKLLPWKALANRSIAVLLIVLGLGVAFAAEDVPGLTLPDSAEAQAAMDSMGMGTGSSGGGSMGEDTMNPPASGGMNDAKGGMNDAKGGMPAK